jgi:FtsP/CotA-like multicopper oxidase with cupredoxin domain
MLQASRSSTRWALIFLMGTGFAMTLITTGSSQPVPTCSPTVQQGGGQQPGFPEPLVRRSLNGRLSTTLTACISTIVMLDQNRVPPVTATFYPPTFEGSIPAPTLSVKPGDNLVLLMNNRLPSNPPGLREGHFPHDQYTFNLHTHGLMVSPLGMSDNIFREMKPSTVNRVEINIPQNHPSGTYWYHVHKHGSATYQFNSGMAGFLIVQGGPGTLDTVPEVAAAKDVPMAFQLVKSLSDGSVVFVHQETQQFGTFPFPGFAYNPGVVDPPPSFIPQPKDQGLWSTYGLDQGPPLGPDGQTLAPPSRYSYTTNGVANPTLRMQPGEVQRWRLLNGTDGDNLQLVLVSNVTGGQGLGLNVVALDAITLPKTYHLAAPVNSSPPVYDPLVLGSGQRADLMVKAPSTPGTYLLQAVDNNSGEIKASVSPYRDSNFPNGITPAGQPSRHSFDFPSPCPAPGAPSQGPNSPCNKTTFNYPITLATIEVVACVPAGFYKCVPTKEMNLPADPLPTPTGLPSIATMLSRTPDKVRNIVFELCGGVTETTTSPPDGQGTIGNFKNLNVSIPSCPWYFAKYDATYWGGTPFTTLLMMRDADDVGQPTGDPNMPLINFQKEGLFDPTQPLFPDMIAGNYEEWTVYNRSFSTHPWHLHQNHVLITKINGVTLPVPEWHDTLLVPAASSPCAPQPASQLAGQRRRAGPAGVPNAAPLITEAPPDPTNTCLGPPNNINLATPGSITFRVYFNPITVGCFVAHCHVIDHEDLGMMQRFDILPAAGKPSGCQLDVALNPNLQKLLAMKDSFQICTSSPPRFASWKQQYPADAEWRAPDLR